MTSADRPELNTEQRLAVEYGGPNYADAGPLLVIAGAGSGKTNTLAHRVAHLIINGIDPRRIMLLTFSRRAAAEMTRRVARILGQLAGRENRSSRLSHAGVAVISDALAWSGTFHALGARLIREYAAEIGLDRAFTIHDREDAADLINLIRHDLGFSRTEQRFPGKGTCLAIYSRVVNAQAPLADVLASFFPWCAEWEAQLRALFATYVEAKQRQHVLDYDDLLLYWAQMMSDDGLAAEVSARFDHVLVDEYQDTNALQAAILLALRPSGRGLTVVGDDAQSIYSFRAASVRNILDFPDQFRPRAALVTLERNYRSTQPILSAANAVIAAAPERFAKSLWSDRASAEHPQLVSVRDEVEQARYVAGKVLAHRENGLALKSQAVLFRASHHSASLEIELARRNIPFVKFGGLRFLESAHVKDVLACLRWAENLRDRVAGFRVVQILPGVGPATAARLLERLTGPTDIVSALADFSPPAAAVEDWPAFAEMMRLVQGRSAGWPAELDLVCRWYAPHLERIHDDAAMRQVDLGQLTHIASTFPSRERFLTELTLDPPEATSGEAGVPLLDEDYLILSTVHSAKGQEWRAVFVLNAVDGCIPSDLATGSSAEIEEERRLLYVAMTRAKDHLHLVVPQRFYAHQQRAGGDRHMYAARTRFIPASMVDHFESCAWPVLRKAAGANDGRAVLDIGARLRGMWG
ncbi:MAG: ATP-dependent helicase [Xanthobacteraceae bacterium]